MENDWDKIGEVQQINGDRVEQTGGLWRGSTTCSSPLGIQAPTITAPTIIELRLQIMPDKDLR